MRRLTVIAAVITGIMVFPIASANAQSVTENDVEVCVGVLSCRLTVNVGLSVISCDAQNCMLSVKGNALGEAFFPGLHQITMTADGGGGSLCSPTKAIQTALDLVGSCSKVCTKTTVGVEAGCAGAVNVTVAAPRGGAEGGVNVFTDFAFDTQYAGWAVSSLTFGVKQQVNGTVEFFVYPPSGF